MKNKKGYIYKLISPNNKIYIGQTVNPTVRKSKYKKLQFADQPKLWNSCQKHNWNPVDSFEIIEEIEDIGENKCNLNIREQYWIILFDSFKNGLNCNEGGGGNIGYVVTEETRNKISERTREAMTQEIRDKIKKARKNQVFSKETRELWSKQRSGANNPNYGKTGELNVNYGKECTKETREKISKANTGENNGMYGRSGELNTSARKYTVETPDGEIFTIIGRKNLIEKLGCSVGFTSTKKYNGYKLLKSEKIYKKQIYDK